MSQVVVLQSKDFLVSLLVLEILNEADFFCVSILQKKFEKIYFMWLKWAMGCECLVWSPWKTLTAPHSTTVLVNNTPAEYLQGFFFCTTNLKMITSNSSCTLDNKLWLEIQIEGCSEHAHTHTHTHTLHWALICGIDRVHCFHRACHYMPCNVIRVRRFMLLYSSPEPDPCCVWSRAEKPSLCPAGPDFCSGLCHCVGLQCCSLLNWKLWFIVGLVFVFHVEGTLGLSSLFPFKSEGNIVLCPCLPRKRCAWESCTGLAGR